MAVRASRGRLAERAYHELRNAILRGELKVGSALAEGEIATVLGISRTPVRQALGLLLQEGLLEVGSRRQLVVCGFSRERREEILQLREALEILAVRRASAVMSLEEIDYLRLLLFRQRRAAREQREDEFIELDEEFHLKIAEGADMPILTRFLGQLRGFVRVMRLGTARAPSHMEQVVAEHEAIVDALERHDVGEALAALETHLHTTEYPKRPPKARQGSSER